jgi:hypothetical protein
MKRWLAFPPWGYLDRLELDGGHRADGSRGHLAASAGRSCLPLGEPGRHRGGRSGSRPLLRIMQKGAHVLVHLLRSDVAASVGAGRGT